MKATVIGVYETQEDAMAAAAMLKQNNYTDKHISVMWRSPEMLDTEDQERRITRTGAAELGAGLSIGGILGVLTGLGVFAIPGFGFLFGAGALVGAVAGMDLGVVGGGIISALSIAGIKKHHEEKYESMLQDGKFLLLVQGHKEEIEKAHALLEAHGQHIEMQVHL